MMGSDVNATANSLNLGSMFQGVLKIESDALTHGIGETFDRETVASESSVSKARRFKVRFDETTSIVNDKLESLSLSSESIVNVTNVSSPSGVWVYSDGSLACSPKEVSEHQSKNDLITQEPASSNEPDKIKDLQINADLTDEASDLPNTSFGKEPTPTGRFVKERTKEQNIEQAKTDELLAENDATNKQHKWELYTDAAREYHLAGELLEQKRVEKLAAKYEIQFLSERIKFDSIRIEELSNKLIEETGNAIDGANNVKGPLNQIISLGKI